MQQGAAINELNFKFVTINYVHTHHYGYTNKSSLGKQGR
jgi:hypothetical protein